MAGMLRFVLRPVPLLLTAAFLACSDQAEPPLAPGIQTDPAAASRSGLMTAGTPTGNTLFLFKNGRIPADFAAEVSRLGGQVVRSHPEIGVASVSGVHRKQMAVLRSRADVDVAAEDKRVQWIPRGESFDPSRVVTFEEARGIAPEAWPTPGPQTDQSGAFFFDFYQWNMRHINADDAWLVSPAGEGVLVCVLDSGIDPGQLDLIGKVDLVNSASFVPHEPHIFDLHFHGTAVASIIAGRGLGMASVAPNARVCALKVLDATGSGAFDGVIAAIMHASAVGADVINLSLGVYIDESFLADPGLMDLYAMLAKAAGHALANDVLLVASAGNEGINLDSDPFGFVHIPSQIPGFLSVGATGPRMTRNPDRVPSYSNYGFTGIHVAAPGGGDYVGELRDLVLMACSQYVCGDIFSYVFANGTSMAAPHVTGAVAVLESSKNRDLTPFALASCVKSQAVQRGNWSGPSQKYGWGRIDVLRMVQNC